MEWIRIVINRIKHLSFLVQSKFPECRDHIHLHHCILTAFHRIWYIEGTQQYLMRTRLLNEWITQWIHCWILIALLAPAHGSRLFYFLFYLTTFLIYQKKGPLVLPTTYTPVVVDMKLEFGGPLEESNHLIRPILTRCRIWLLLTEKWMNEGQRMIPFRTQFGIWCLFFAPESQKFPVLQSSTSSLTAESPSSSSSFILRMGISQGFLLRYLFSSPLRLWNTSAK